MSSSFVPQALRLSKHGRNGMPPDTHCCSLTEARLAIEKLSLALPSRPSCKAFGKYLSYPLARTDISTVVGRTSFIAFPTIFVCSASGSANFAEGSFHLLISAWVAPSFGFYTISQARLPPGRRLTCWRRIAICRTLDTILDHSARAAPQLPTRQIGRQMVGWTHRPGT